MIEVEGLLEGEEVLPYPENEKYLVSNLGRVYSLHQRRKDGKVMGWIRGSCVDQIRWFNLLYSLGEYKWLRKPGYRLVAETWIDNPERYTYVIFLDYDKRNIKVSNLDWSKDKLGRTYVPRQPMVESEETRLRRSRSKMGKAHPSFRGYYVIFGVSYESASQAAKELGTYAADVIRRCKKKKVKGWDFIPLEEVERLGMPAPAESDDESEIQALFNPTPVVSLDQTIVSEEEKRDDVTRPEDLSDEDPEIAAIRKNIMDFL